MRPPSLWDDWRSAELYRDYVHRFPIYRALNRRLAELAELASARRVLDLGCGTGATASACLERLPPDAELVGLDASPAMVELARAWVEDPRARFVVAPAARPGLPGGETFDRVVSNAAFWLFGDRRGVLRQVARRLEAGGLLVFNLPGQRLEGETAASDPFQRELARAVASRGGGGAPLRLFERSRIRRALERVGLALERVEPFVHRGAQRELIDLMRIPAMAGRVAPGLDIESSLDAVEQAAASSDPDLPIEIPWVYFVARRDGAVA